MLYTCPCCGFKMFSELPGNYEICDICRWEDDYIQLEDPSYRGGANKVSLIQGQENFKKLGVSDPSFKEFVRKPKDTDIKDSKWYPIKSLSDMKFTDRIYYWDESSEKTKI